MTVLFQNRDPKAWIGGDQIQLDKTREALEKLGVETRFSSLNIADPEDIVDVDIVHCFNFSMPWTKYQIWNAKKLKKKVVCSMIYHETDQFISYETQQAMIDELDYCIFLTEGEVFRALRHLKIPLEKIKIIPNGIESWWFNEVIPAPQFDVLTVGRMDGTKGQVAVAQACKKLGLTYFCIGEKGSETEELQRLRVTVIEPLSHEKLKPYYAACKIYALASKNEVMPLTVMEAGTQAKNIVLTSGCEWKIPAEYVKYQNFGSICQGIEKSLTKGPNLAFKEQLRSMTWDSVALKLKELYD